MRPDIKYANPDPILITPYPPLNARVIFRKKMTLAFLSLEHSCAPR